MNERVTIALDLSEVEAKIKRQDEGTGIDIMGLDGETPLGLKIFVVGPDSKRAQQAQDQLTEEVIRSQVKGKPKNDQLSKNIELGKTRGIRYLANITIKWEPKVILDGEEVAYSLENAEKLYSRFKFIREQVDKAANDRALFSGG